jgi:cytochrome P450
MDRIGKQLLHERELALDSGQSENGGNDILSLLVRGNAASDKQQRLPEEQVIARKRYALINFISLSLISLTEIPTFIVAGHETTR